MVRLPISGKDEGEWGDILNDFLLQEHAGNGRLRIRTDGTLDGYYKLPSGGIPATDLAPDVRHSLEQINNAPDTDFTIAMAIALG